MSVPIWFQNLSFPLLREVTDYIMLYETAGIVSMAKLFPNLSVIRGNHLFKVNHKHDLKEEKLLTSGWTKATAISLNN